MVIKYISPFLSSQDPIEMSEEVLSGSERTRVLKNCKGGSATDNPSSSKSLKHKDEVMHAIT